MELALGRILNVKVQSKKNEDSIADKRMGDLKAELSDIKENMRTIQSKFDLTSDDDLIEAYIYEMEAWEARYRSVYKKAKLLNIV